jgi:gliding motility associated protien GldN
MKLLLKGALSVLLMVVLTSSWAQNADDVIKMKESSQPLDEKYLNDIVERKLTLETRVIPYEPLREADVPWQRTVWRVIETREKMNIPFRNPQRPLFDILKENVFNGNLVPFEDDKFDKPLTQEAINSQLIKEETSTVYDPDTYEETVTVTRTETNAMAINRYRVKEIWYFDRKHSVVKVRILGISPLKEEWDVEMGVLKYEIPLFWVYYPEAREILSKEKVFSDFNDVFPMTWYDLFETRFFSSYIMKASNVLDLRLEHLFPKSEEAGLDILLESEKIKKELFNFEHDLWEY